MRVLLQITEDCVAYPIALGLIHVLAPAPTLGKLRASGNTHDQRENRPASPRVGARGPRNGASSPQGADQNEWGSS
jgi:hypothetical protein